MIRHASHGAEEPGLASTAHLLDRARSGDARAREELVARFLPILRRWAHHRLPGHARALADTDDLVQISLVRALNRVDDFESRGEGAFLAYLRTILMNALRDEIRRADRRPVHVPLEDEAGEPLPCELERLVGRERLELYERALAAVSPAHREAVILRLEFGYSYPEIASALARPNADAARMVVARGIVAMTKVLDGLDA